MRLSTAKAIMCLRMLLEGSSIRSIERLTGVNRNTIVSLLVLVGQRSKAFLDNLRHVPVEDVQIDELWGFVGCKEKTRARLGRGEDKGDCWCFTAIERTTKMIVAHHVGKRTPEAAMLFTEKLRRATRFSRFQLSSDGFTPYPTTIDSVFGPNIDYGQIIKIFGNSPETGTAARYSPGEVTGTYKNCCMGNPDPDRICTSHVERSNKTLRMQIRRLTWLTDSHSKKWENHEAALAMFFAFYNYCRPHTTLAKQAVEEGVARRPTTPAMMAGMTDHVWTVGELLQQIASTHS
jgi:IS1 family transposase